jgi:N-acyl-D-amino-acid deacylase
MPRGGWHGERATGHVTRGAPREWGRFPLLIRHYARDLGQMSLEEAVPNIRSLPDNRLRPVDRRVIAEGFWADLVVFDSTTISSNGSPENPTLPPGDIHHVFVNGEQTLLRGRKRCQGGEAARV